MSAIFLLLSLVQQALDPAAWGKNHAGQPLPEYIHGDECLFCHRNDIGLTWQKNTHGITVRQREDAPELNALLEPAPAQGAGRRPASAPALVWPGPAAKTEYLLGSRRRVRFLQREGYGKFALLSTQAVLGPGGLLQRWIGAENPVWDKEHFGSRCAGCHCTAVDSRTRTFSAFGLDCYTCHGVVPLEHTRDTSLAWLSNKRRDDSQAITSICAQCHLRTGTSRSTALPYPNNFVAGDNLFQDFQVDFARAEDEKLNPGDRHVLRNVRDVALYGSTTTCLNCHQVHRQSSRKHRWVLRAPICQDCHLIAGSFKATRAYTVESPLCEY